MTKILIVDDDAELRGRISGILTKNGYYTSEASTGKEAIERVQDEEFDVILIDLVMPGISGIDAIIALRNIRRQTKIIMITAFATVGTAVEAMKKGASEYISKPFKIEDLLVIIRRVLEEAKFEKNINSADLNTILSSLSNPIRRDIIQLLYSKKRMRFNEIVKGVGVEDHTKVVFHVKILREAGIISQDKNKLYVLTDEGEKNLERLRTLEKSL